LGGKMNGHTSIYVPVLDSFDGHLDNPIIKKISEELFSLGYQPNGFVYLEENHYPGQTGSKTRFWVWTRL